MQLAMRRRSSQAAFINGNNDYQPTQNSRASKYNFSCYRKRKQILLMLLLLGFLSVAFIIIKKSSHRSEKAKAVAKEVAKEIVKVDSEKSPYLLDGPPVEYDWSLIIHSGKLFC